MRESDNEMSGNVHKIKQASFEIEPADELTKEIRDVFDIYDSEKCGKIDQNRLKVALRALGFEPSKEDIGHFISNVRFDESGQLSLEEFTKLVVDRLTEKDYRQDILLAFRLFDDDETGKISFKNLKRIAKGLGETMSDDELQQMITEADLDGDGEVNEEDFYRIMAKSNLY